MSDCLFCKIVSGDIPCVKIWEDENYLAILDVFPNREGMTLVIPKKHQTSKFCDVDKDFFGDIMKASHHVANILKKGLGVDRIGLVIEGLEVNHLHIKLYPFYEKNGKIDGFQNGIASGSKADFKELQKLAEKLKG